MEQEFSLSVGSSDSLEAGLGGQLGGITGVQEVSTLSRFLSLVYPNADLGVVDRLAVLEVEY